MNRTLKTTLFTILISVFLNNTVLAKTEINLQSLSNADKQKLSERWDGHFLPEEAINAQIEVKLISLVGGSLSIARNVIVGTHGFSKDNSRSMPFWPFDDNEARELLPLPVGKSVYYPEQGFGVIDSKAKMYQARAEIYIRYWGMSDYELQLNRSYVEYSKNIENTRINELNFVSEQLDVINGYVDFLQDEAKTLKKIENSSIKDVLSDEIQGYLRKKVLEVVKKEIENMGDKIRYGSNIVDSKLFKTGNSNVDLILNTYSQTLADCMIDSMENSIANVILEDDLGLKNQYNSCLKKLSKNTEELAAKGINKMVGIGENQVKGYGLGDALMELKNGLFYMQRCD